MSFLWMIGDALEKVGLALIFLATYRAVRVKSTDLSIEKR